MAGDAPEHLVRVRSLPCAMCGTRGHVEAHHKTGAGMALRASDLDAMPLCRMCHHDLHALTGRFRDMDRWRRRAWEADAVRETLRLLSGDGVPY